MGLDMYLTKRTYIWSKDREKLQLSMIKTHPEDDPLSAIKPKRISEIIEHVAYWRKSNQIHRWFVQNVQNGDDNCQEHYVETKQLEQLLKIVCEVLEDHSKAEELLPTESGFFFGGTDYDEWYFKDLEETKEMLEAVLAEDTENASFYYHSSW